MHKPEYILGNEIHKILWDFGIQTDCQIPAKRPNLGLINNKNKKKIREFAVPAAHQVKIKEVKR